MRLPVLFILISPTLSGIAAAVSSGPSEQVVLSRTHEDGQSNQPQVEAGVEPRVQEDEGSSLELPFSGQAVEEIGAELELKRQEEALSLTQEKRARDFSALKRSALYLLIPLVLSFLVHDFVVRPRVERVQQVAAALWTPRLMDEENAYVYVLEEDRLSLVSTALVFLLSMGLLGNFIFRLSSVILPRLLKKKNTEEEEEESAAPAESGPKGKQRKAVAADPDLLLTRLEELAKAAATETERKDEGEKEEEEEKERKDEGEKEEKDEEEEKEKAGETQGGDSGQQQPSDSEGPAEGPLEGVADS
ncbi:hypothetical protein Efla_002316 [Eimeria flavescens]